ncbi:MAG TPA: prephenate dehydratase domain-containing protein [Candidatus Dormibacteraeota bacterium]|nr:prephenate dehydratase domain-containing protein [Candidatus Dormibacteraeota bacterium]
MEPGEGPIAYQGEPGAYSEEAAQHLFPDAVHEGYATFAAAFEAVAGGQAEAAVLPVENSVAGVVQEVSDQLWAHPELNVVGERVIPIRHHLLRRGSEPVRRALSHPQALAQCAGWLTEHHILPVVFADTAGAAREIAERGQPGDGAIASRAAAERYRLQVVAEDIADQPSNRTRFLVVRQSPRLAPGVGSIKLILGLVAEHRPGGLAQVLQVFAKEEVNLTRLDSRPVPEQPFNYRFYLDGVVADADRLPALLQALRRVTAELRLFGTFPIPSAGR